MASIPVFSRSLIWPRFLLTGRWSCSNATSSCAPSRIFHSPPLPRSHCAMATPQDPSSPTKTERVVIKGRVQGVFYRNWTVENAAQLGLKGWVRNRRDGSVEALFSGTPDSVEEMERRCRRGPPEAVVTGFEVFPASGDGDDLATGFQRRPTV